MEHRGDEPLVMRERNEEAGRRPGNVEEQPDAIPHAVRAKPFAERQEMIILHPDDVLLLDQRIKAVRELLVDALITAAEPIPIFRKNDAVVKKRAQGAVGIAVEEFTERKG